MSNANGPAETNDAHKFLDAVDEDRTLQKQLAATVDDVTKIGESHGYKFTPDQFREALRKRWDMKSPPNYDLDQMASFFG